MFFLLRTAFWFSLVLLLLPFGGEGDEGPQVGPLQALLAARAAFNDFTGICERQPGVCETGKAAMHTVAVRAKATARYAYEWLGDDEARPNAIETAETAVADGEASVEQVIRQSAMQDAIETGTVPHHKPATKVDAIKKSTAKKPATRKAVATN